MPRTQQPCRRPTGELDEFLGSYADEYARIREEATKQYPSLISVFECDDAVFYDATAAERLTHFALSHFSIVTFRNTAPFGQSTGSKIGSSAYAAPKPRPTKPEVGGLTYVLKNRSNRHTAVFLRRSTGIMDCGREIDSMFKLVVLLHELGHVDDFEQGINYSTKELNLQNAEVYAHHFACRALIRHRYRIALGWYLQQLDEMAGVDVSAARVVNSREYDWYQQEVSTFYQRRRLNCQGSD